MKDETAAGYQENNYNVKCERLLKVNVRCPDASVVPDRCVADDPTCIMYSLFANGYVTIKGPLSRYADFPSRCFSFCCSCLNEAGFQFCCL
jgi:hypothetical protein